DCHAFRWVTASPSVGSRTRARRDAQQDARATNAPTVARRTVPVAPVPKSSGSAKSRPTNAWATVRYAPRPNERRRRGVAEPHRGTLGPRTSARRGTLHRRLRVEYMSDDGSRVHPTVLAFGLRARLCERRGRATRRRRGDVRRRRATGSASTDD